jgi:hypothetical protein
MATEFIEISEDEYQGGASDFIEITEEEFNTPQEPVGTSIGQEISQLPAALKQSFGQPLEAIGETAQVAGFPAVGAALRGAIQEPQGYVSAGERFMAPQEGEFQVAGFAPQYAPRAVAEQTGQILYSIGSRIVGKFIGRGLGGLIGPTGGAIGGAAGELVGPAAFAAAQVVGPVALERAKNNGYTEPTDEDMAYAISTAAVSGALDSFATRFLPGGKEAVGPFFKRLGASFLGQSVPEGLQSFAEQIGGTIETKKGIQVSPKKAVGEALIGGGAGVAATVIAAPFTPEQIEEQKITESANKEAENLVIGNDNPQGKAVLANKQKLEQEIADAKQVLSVIESTDPVAQKLKLELKEKEAILAAAQGQVDSIVDSNEPVVEAEKQQIELAKAITTPAPKPLPTDVLPTETPGATYGREEQVYDVFGGITRKPVSIPKPAELPAAPTIEEQTAEKTYGGETGVFDVFAGARRKPVAQEAPAITPAKTITMQEASDRGYTQRDPSSIRRFKADKITTDSLTKHLEKNGFQDGDVIETAQGTAEIYVADTGFAYSWKPKKGNGREGNIKDPVGGVKINPVVMRDPNAPSLSVKVEKTSPPKGYVKKGDVYVYQAPVAETPAVTPAAEVKQVQTKEDFRKRFLAEEVTVTKDDPRFSKSIVKRFGLGQANVIEQKNLFEIVDSPSVFHETNLQSIRNIVSRIKQGPRSADLWASNSLDLALGQEGKGYVIELDTQNVNGRVAKSLAANIMSGIGAKETEIKVNKTLPQSIKSIIAPNNAGVNALRKTAGFEKLFDFDNATKTERGIQIPVKQKAPTPAVSETITPAAEPAGKAEEVTPRKPATFPTMPSIEEQTAEKVYGGETGLYDPFAGVQKKRTKAEDPAGRRGTEDQIKNADEHAAEIGGTVLYQDGDISLIRGYSLWGGNPVYIVANKSSRARTDISSYTGNLATPEQKAQLVDIKNKIETEDQASFNSKPFITFTDGIAFSNGVPSTIAGVLRGWKSLLNIKANLYVTTYDDAVADKDKFNGPHRVIGSAGLASSKVDGSIRKMPNGDFYIMFREIPSRTKMLETLAHELGHLHEKEAFENADTATKRMLREEHDKWVKSQTGKTAKELVTSLRAVKTAKANLGAAEGMMADELSAYWKSFGEWYADQVSRWAVSTEKPLTIVDKFFSRIAKALRSFYANLTNRGYLPNETFVQYLEKTLKEPARIVSEPIMEGEGVEQLSQQLGGEPTPIEPEAKTITEGLVQGIDIGKENNMPINNKIESHIKNFAFVRGIFESASDRLRRAKFTKLATAIDDYYDQAQRRLGFANKILLPAFDEYSKQSKATKKKIDEEVKRFFAAQENKRDTAEFFDELNPITQKIVTAWQKFGEESGSENQRIGIKVFDKGLQRWRPIGKVEKFWPRVLKPEYKRALMEPDKYQKEYNEIVEALMKSGRIQTPEEAEAFISDYQGTGSQNDYFSGIEAARGQAFPEELYDYSTQVMTDYVARWAQHSSRIEQFGQKLGENSKTLWDRSRESTRDRRTIDYITAAQERVEGYYPNDPIVKGMATLNIWSSGLQLGNPASSMLNFFGGTTLNAMVGQPGALSSYVSSFAELRKLGRELKDAREKGIVSRDLMNIVGDHQVVLESSGLAKAGQKTTDFLLKWSGFTPVEQMVRTQSMIIGKSFLRKTLSSLSKNPNNSFSKRALTWLNRNNIDADKLIVEQGTGPETDKLLRYFANISQGSYTISQTPIFTDTPIGRFLFKYQKFSTQVMRQSWKNTFEPAWKAVTNKNEALQLPDPTRQLLYRLRLAEAKELGDNRKITLDEIPKKVTKAEGKALTIIPVMMWLGAAYVGGEVILRLRDMLFGVLMKGPEYEDIIKAFEDDEDDDELYLSLERAWYNLIGMGALGLIGNYAQFFMDWQDRERVKNPLDPPALSIFKETATFIQNAVDQGKITVGDVNNYLNRTFSAYRVSQRLYQTAASGLGYSDAPTVAEEMFRREVASINKYARRWASSAGLEYRTKRPMDIAPSKMTPINREIANYLQRGEPGAAAAYAKEYLKSLPKSERANAIQSMESGARNRQPLRLGSGPMDQAEKIAFKKWLKEKVSKEKFDEIQKLESQYQKNYNIFLNNLPNK